jgi:hypothetical protein
MFNTTVLAPEYYTFAALDQPYTNQEKGTGVYQCFCELQSKSANFTKAVNAIEKNQTGVDNAAENLCGDWKGALRGGTMISTGVSASVTLVNMIIRGLNIFLVSKVGYHSYSAQTARVVDCIFIATFINTAFVLLLGNANLSNTAIGFMGVFFHGEYTDMT